MAPQNRISTKALAEALAFEVDNPGDNTNPPVPPPINKCPKHDDNDDLSNATYCKNYPDCCIGGIPTPLLIRICNATIGDNVGFLREDGD